MENFFGYGNGLHRSARLCRQHGPVFVPISIPRRSAPVCRTILSDVMTRDPSGLKTIAVFEAAKGAIVLIAAAGLISLVHKDAQAAAEEIVRQFHLNPASRYPHIFLDAAASLSSGKLWLLAGGAFLYAAIRFAEAYGLWHERAWAEWLGAISGSIYVPIEVYELTRGIGVVKVSLLILNLGIVAFLGRAIYRSSESVSSS